MRRILRRSRERLHGFAGKTLVVRAPTQGALFAGCRTGPHRAAPDILDHALPAASPTSHAHRLTDATAVSEPFRIECGRAGAADRDDPRGLP